MDGLSNSHIRTERYAHNSDEKQCYLGGSLALEQPNYEEMKKRSLKGKLAVECSWVTPPVEFASSSSSSSSSEKMSTEISELRRNAIVFLFAKFGYPPEEEWGHGFGVIADIMLKLAIPSGSRTSVINVLKDALVAADRQYDPNSANKNKGRPTLLEDGTLQGIMVCRTLQRGVGITQTTWLLNRLRRQHPGGRRG